VVAIKEKVEPYAPGVFARCLKILGSVLQSLHSNPDSMVTLTDFYIRSMDLISSVIGALGPKALPLVTDSNLGVLLSGFLDLGDLCMKQYVFAMVGDF
jgi:hypothetical protein